MTIIVAKTGRRIEISASFCMRGQGPVAVFHELACSAGFPACGFTGLSSPVDQERATGKSPEPAGSKACATNPQRFMVPMRAKNSVGALHEPKRRTQESFQEPSLAVVLAAERS